MNLSCERVIQLPKSKTNVLHRNPAYTNKWIKTVKIYPLLMKLGPGLVFPGVDVYSRSCSSSFLSWDGAEGVRITSHVATSHSPQEI